MNIEKLTEMIAEIISEFQFKVYSVKFKTEFGAQILEILLDEENLSHDLIEPIHEKLLDQIDAYLPENTFLELSGVGAERPLNNIEEVTAHINGYVYVVSDYYKGYGTILKTVEELITLEVNEKGRKVRKEIPYSKISQIRKAIKI